VSSLSCRSATSCTATGFSGEDGAGNPQIFQGNGTSWTEVTTPLPAGRLA
jgi:hypothetical protein